MPKFRTLAQNNKLFGLAAKLGLSHDDLRDYAAEVTDGRTERTSKLYIAECDEIIHRLESALNIPNTPTRTVNHRRQETGIPRIITPQHKAKISQLLQQRNISRDGYKSLCLRMLKHDEPRTTSEANKIIEALKAMNARDAAKQEAA